MFGLYVITHGQITPGGGFQGGVILASAPLLLYLCAEYRQFRSAAPQRLAALSESMGAAAYILIGGLGVTLGAGCDVGVGCEVSGGLPLALLVYFDELLEEKEE